MITTGPFAVMAGSPLIFLDPDVGGANTTVQIQNMTGFTLVVNFGFGTVSIPGDSAVTGPSYGGGQINASVLGVGPPGIGVICQWMLPGENPPTPDGPLQVQSTPALNAGAASVSFGSPATIIAGAGETVIRLWHAEISMAADGAANEMSMQISGGGVVILTAHVQPSTALFKERSFLPWGVPFILGSSDLNLAVAVAGAAGDGSVVYSFDVP